MNEMNYFILILTVVLALVLLYDGVTRGRSIVKSLFWAILPFISFIFFPPLFAMLWSFLIIPVYFATRPLKLWEVRVGGTYWHIARNVTISLCILIILGLTLFFTAREILRKSGVPAVEINALVGSSELTRIITLPILAVFIAFGVGRYFRDPSLVERGEAEARLIEQIVYSLPKTRSLDLRALGINEMQAAELRDRFQTFAEDWDHPDMRVYDEM